MRMWVAVAVLWTLVAATRPVSAAYHSSSWDLALPIALAILPSTAGVALSQRGDDLRPQLLLTWQMQIPLSGMSDWGTQFQPRVRLVIEPIVVLAESGVELEARIAPRIAIPFAPGYPADAWARTALLLSAGTTVAFAPLDPSLNAEIGITRKPGGGTDGFKWWVGLRGDAWLLHQNQYRVALMVGWALF